MTKVSADNKRLGRLASRVAKLLIQGQKVVVKDIDKIEQTSKDKVYYSYSGHPGGLKKRTYKDIGPREAFKKAVRGMLPDNKLRKKRMKKLEIT